LEILDSETLKSIPGHVNFPSSQVIDFVLWVLP